MENNKIDTVAQIDFSPIFKVMIAPKNEPIIKDKIIVKKRRLLRAESWSFFEMALNNKKQADRKFPVDIVVA